jgi:hypothetical protein
MSDILDSATSDGDLNIMQNMGNFTFLNDNSDIDSPLPPLPQISQNVKTKPVLAPVIQPQPMKMQTMPVPVQMPIKMQVQPMQVQNQPMPVQNQPMPVQVQVQTQPIVTHPMPVQVQTISNQPKSILKQEQTVKFADDTKQPELNTNTVNTTSEIKMMKVGKLNVPNVTVYFTAAIVLIAVGLFYGTAPKKNKKDKRDK